MSTWERGPDPPYRIFLSASNSTIPAAVLTLRQRSPAACGMFTTWSPKRSIIDFARRYGLQFAVAQLLLGLGLWSISLKRFGRPRPPPESVRVGATDALFAMSRLYREGGHHPFAAGLIAKGLTQDLAIYAGLPAHSSAPAVAEGLLARSREDLSQEPGTTVLPAAVLAGTEPFLVVGAMAGG